MLIVTSSQHHPQACRLGLAPMDGENMKGRRPHTRNMGGAHLDTGSPRRMMVEAEVPADEWLIHFLTDAPQVDRIEVGRLSNLLLRMGG
jgi:hypothetical protein